MTGIIQELLEILEETDGDLKERLNRIYIKLDDIDENDAILNSRNFKRELERQGLMTEKLEKFIENYLRFDNDF